MGRTRKPTVRFSLESSEHKEELESYAKQKGFANAGTLARVALFQYISRHPLKKSQGCTAQKAEGE